MKNKAVFITDCDIMRLKVLLDSAEQWPNQDQDLICLLRQKLGSAQVARQKEVPPYLVTMNSHVRVTDLNAKRDLKFWLAYPEDAFSGNDKISVLSPIGIAVLGAKVGDIVDARKGSKKVQLRVAQMYYQPEDYKHYAL